MDEADAPDEAGHYVPPINREHALLILKFLQKHKFDDVATTFMREANLSEEDLKLPLILAPRVAICVGPKDPDDYFDTYIQFRDYVDQFLMVYRPEIGQLLWPVFVYIYLDLICNDEEARASRFFMTFADMQASFHEPDLIALKSIKRKEHLEGSCYQHFVTVEYSESEPPKITFPRLYVVRMSEHGFRLLDLFLLEDRMKIVRNILEDRIFLQVYRGRARGKAAINAIAGHFMGEAPSQVNNLKVYYGLLQNPKYDLPIVPMIEGRELADAVASISSPTDVDVDIVSQMEPNIVDRPDSPTASGKSEPNIGGEFSNTDKSCLKSNMYQRTNFRRPTNDPNGPPLSRMPLPDLLDTETETTQKYKKLFQKNPNLAEPETVNLPKIRMHSITERDHQVTCVKWSEDGTRLAVGFASSHIKLWALEDEKVYVMNTIHDPTEPAKIEVEPIEIQTGSMDDQKETTMEESDEILAESKNNQKETTMEESDEILAESKNEKKETPMEKSDEILPESKNDKKETTMEESDEILAELKNNQKETTMEESDEILAESKNDKKETTMEESDEILAELKNNQKETTMEESDEILAESKNEKKETPMEESDEILPESKNDKKETTMEESDEILAELKNNQKETTMEESDEILAESKNEKKETPMEKSDEILPESKNDKKETTMEESDEILAELKNNQKETTMEESDEILPESKNNQKETTMEESDEILAESKNEKKETPMEKSDEILPESKNDKKETPDSSSDDDEILTGSKDGQRLTAESESDEIHTTAGNGIQLSEFEELAIKWGMPLPPRGFKTVTVIPENIRAFYARRPFKKEKPIRHLKGHTGAVYSLDFSYDKNYLLSASEDSTIRLWSLEEWTCVMVYNDGSLPVWKAVFSPHRSHYFASCGHDKTARLWATNSNECLRIFAGHYSDVTTVEFHPNSNYVASGSADRSVRLWDNVSGNCVRLLTGHQAVINDLKFSNNGRFLISAASDGIIIVWDLADGHLLKVLTKHEGPVYNVSLYRDGVVLATVGRDCAIRFWNFKRMTQEGRIAIYKDEFLDEDEAADAEFSKNIDGSKYYIKEFMSSESNTYGLHFDKRNDLFVAGPVKLAEN